MNLALVAASFFWIYGIGLLIYLYWHWTDSNKKDVRISELSYVIFLFVIGFYTLNLYVQESVSIAGSNLGYTMIIIAGVFINTFLILNHIAGRMGYKKYGLHNDPVITRDYPTFLSNLERKYATGYARDDIVKDISRKALHLVVLAIVIATHEISFILKDELMSYGLTPLAFRNTMYLTIALLFCCLFLYADTLRITRFYDLPNWARKWYNKSLDEKKEIWTYISSTPFLLSLLMLIFLPMQILFVSTAVSCLADAAASVVGKSYGKHKLGKLGYYPHKSYEGLFAGMLSAFISVYFVFVIWPMNEMTIFLQIAIALMAAFSFGITDIFGKFIADNVLNTIVPAISTLILITLFL